MIAELKKSEFPLCRGLLYDQSQLEAKAVIEGVNPGRVFVDDRKTPTAGLVWLGNNDGFLFIGDERNEKFITELNHFIDTVITPEARKVGLAWFEGVGNHPKWNAVIEKLFEHRKLGSWNQRVYTLQKDDYQDSPFPLEQGYRLVKITETLYHNHDHAITNIEFLHAKIAEFWSSAQEFFQEGVGYGIVCKNEMVSLCFSGFVVDNVHCIDIETLEKHQGKKLAQQAACAFVEECLANDFVPYWDCMESNKPSIAVAEKIGFRKIFTYKGYEFPFA
jgi:RimJ/RimL family protein N-acetyltransferase